MSATDESYVLVGGRKSFSEVHVEHEAAKGNLRYRSSQSGTPQADRTYTARQGGPSPTLKDLAEGRVEVGIDSGYGGGFRNTSTVKKRLDYASNPDGSYIEERVGSPVQPSLWETVSSPVLDLSKKIQGRQSFLDAGRQKHVQHHHMLAGIVLIVVVSSLGFALLISYNHFSDIQNATLNGKMKSIKFGSEQRMASLKQQGRILSRELRDETGASLGGKRAAIQYAYDSQVEDEILDDEAGLEYVAGSVEVDDPVPLPPLEQVMDQVGYMELSARMDSLSRMLEEDLAQNNEISRSDASEDVPDLGEDVDAENDEDIEDEPQGASHAILKRMDSSESLDNQDQDGTSFRMTDDFATRRKRNMQPTDEHFRLDGVFYD